MGSTVKARPAPLGSLLLLLLLLLGSYLQPTKELPRVFCCILATLPPVQSDVTLRGRYRSVLLCMGHGIQHIYRKELHVQG